MTPSVSAVLNGIARTLMTEIAPQLAGSYGAHGTTLAAMLAMMAAQEFERGAARLVEENAAIEALLADGVALASSALRSELESALAAREPSLLISALQARNDTLRAALTHLHAHVETLDTPEARRLEARIWAELVASTERRKLELAMPS